MSALPNGWRSLDLKDLLRDGMMNGRSVQTKEGGFPVLRLTALKGARVDLAERKGGDWTSLDAAPFLVREGDFFVSRGNGSLSLVGRGSLLDHEPDPVAFPDTMIRIRVDTRKISPSFLALQWNSQEIRRQIEDAARTTAGILKVNQSILNRITLRVPPLTEQQKIVDILEDHLSRLGAAATYQHHALRRINRMHAATMGLLWERAASCGPLVPIAAIGDVVTGSTPPTKQADAFGGTLPFVTPSDVGHGQHIASWNRSLSDRGAQVVRTVGPNAVLAVCIGATLGKVGWVDSRVSSNQQINSITIEPSMARARFVSALMASHYFQKKMLAGASSTTMPILNKSRFGRLTLPLPDLVGQQNLLTLMDEQSAAMERASAATDGVLKKVAAFRQSLLVAAFSGRLTGRTSDMDIGEEMADV